ncbi:MAG TPA: redoxin domain-containing protein [Chloroflexi bacterium]|jgi:hypothetical protein|nr:redoxin domain-containing protein [Chloroflexota bacterium]
MSEETLSCVEPLDETPAEAPEAQPAAAPQPAAMTVARVGQKAPDFSGMAYVDGGFKRVSLLDYRGKWTMICFYPGDFTFV